MSSTALDRATIARELRTEAAKLMNREDIECRIFTKINDTCRYGLMIGGKKGEARPTIYIDNYIRSVEHGHPVGWVAKSLVKIIEDAEKYDAETCQSGESTYLVSTLTKEMIFKKAFFEIVDPEWNKEYLKDKVTFVADCCPDMTLLVRVELTEDKSFAFGTVMLDKYEINRGDLLYNAWINTVRKPMTAGPLGEILKKMGSPEVEDDSGEMGTTMMLSYGQYGAAVMACGTETLKKMAAKMNDDLIILPSSIHEILTMPYSEVISVDDMKAMVQDVNRMNVPREEQLSDSVFLYERRTNTVRRL